MMGIFGTRQQPANPVKVLEDALATTQAKCSEAERQRDEMCKDLAEAQDKLAIVQQQLADLRLRYYEAIGRYDQGQLDAVQGGGR